MKSTESQSSVSCNTHFSTMLNILNQKLRRLCSRLRWPIRRRSKPKIIIRKFGKSTSKTEETNNSHHGSPTIINQNGDMGCGGTVKKTERSVRIATFNAAMFSMAPAVPKVENSIVFDYGEDEEEEDCLKKKINKHSMELDIRAKSVNDRPKGILKQSPLHPNSVENCTSTTTTTTTTAENHSSRKQNFAKSRLRVSINLPDNEISLERSRQLNSASSKDEKDDKNSNRNLKGKGPLRSSRSLPSNNSISRDYLEGSFRSNRTILEVLREVDADILALQDVKAEEEKGMKPLSDLASALGMKYVFAESWAPEYGNAVLSKWPIKKWHVQKIFDDTDFRNVLKVTVDVPRVGEINFDCTHLDHLDENWRMKQINAIIKSNSTPHILAGGLNSLEDTDYSAERWTDIVKYYEEIGKPTPKVEVMRFLKGMKYVDSKDFAGECESVVMIAKGQNVQGTCKYGTRVDYILTSEESPYKFVPGSYSVLSSKGTSDHHIVKVDIVKVENNEQENVTRQRRKPKQKVVKMTNNSSMSKGIWRINT